MVRYWYTLWLIVTTTWNTPVKSDSKAEFLTLSCVKMMIKDKRVSFLKG